MFNFFHTIFSGVTSLLAGAIIAVGIVSMPPLEPVTQPLQQPQPSQNEEVVVTQEIETQKPESAPAPVKSSIPKTSETTPTLTSKPTTTLAPALTPTPTSTSTSVSTSTITSPLTSNKGEWVLDTRSGSPDYGKQFWVPEGQTLDQVRPLTTATTTITTESLKIISVNVSSTFNTMAFEWTTNRLTESKVFLSGGGLSNVYKSESGPSTRHIDHISNLNGNTNYSYEIEAIADGEVIKKQSAFSTKQVKENAQVKIGFESAGSSFIEVYYYENGKRVDAEAVTVSADGAVEFIESSYPNHHCVGAEAANTDGTQRKGNPLTCPTRPSGRDGQPVAYFGYVPLTSGDKKITATVNGVIATVIAKGSPFAPKGTDPTIQAENINVELPQNYTGMTIGKFSFSTADEEILVSQIIYESDIKGIENFYLTISGLSLGFFSETMIMLPNITSSLGSQTFIIKMGDTKNYIGTHTFTIKEVKVFGQSSGILRNVLGLPITFTFTIK